MKYLLDDVVKTLATPMPRRKTFRLLGGLLAGGILGGMGVRPAFATQGGCGSGPACPTWQVCCSGGGFFGFFGFRATCLKGVKCCGNGACSASETCCGTNCVNGTDVTCCGNTVCTGGDVCCGQGFLRTCAKSTDCCGGQVCRNGQKCCRNATYPYCYSNTNSKSCPASAPPS